jgi:Amidohydrolase family
MILTSLLLSLTAAPADQGSATPNLFAVRVGRAETISKGTIEHAVILVEGGKIITIGEDLPIERGIPVFDQPTWVVMPGLVNPYSRYSLDSDGGDDNAPEALASIELYPDSKELREIVEAGVTTLGLYPPGNGIPGQSVAIRPIGDTKEELILKDGCYLKILARANPAAKRAIKDGFKKADDYAEKEKKAKEKWDKDNEKKKTPEKKEEPKPDAPKEEEKKDAAPAGGYVPPTPEPKAKPFVDLRAERLRAVVSVQSAAEYLHYLDAIGEEKFLWDLRLPITRESDLFYVLSKAEFELDVDGIGDKKVRCILEPTLSVMPGTLRTRNLAKDIVAAGGKLAFVPRSDSLGDHKAWLSHVGEIVNAGLDRSVALRAVTLEAASVLGVESRLGSLEKGKDANMIFFDGDPLESSSRLKAVMLDGRIVFGEVKL